MMTSGMVTIVPAAMTAVYGSWCGWAPVKFAIATVTGWVFDVESWLASRNSFQAAMNARIAVVNRPGRRQRQDDLPERLARGAAVDPGRLLEVPRHLGEERRQGVDRQRQRERDVRDDQRLVVVPIQPMLVNSWNSGVTSATPGNIEAPRMKPEHEVLAAELQPRQRVGGEDADHHGDDRGARRR